MAGLPPDVRAERRELVWGLMAFVISFLLSVAGLAWLAGRFSEPDTRWWEYLPWIIRGFFLALLSGGIGALWVVCSLRWFHRLLGIYRCDTDSQRGFLTPFPVSGAWHWVNIRRAFLVFVALVPVSLVAASLVGRRSDPPGVIFFQLQTLLSVFVALCLEAASSILAWKRRDHPLARRIDRFKIAFAVWPAICVSACLVWEWLKQKPH